MPKGDVKSRVLREAMNVVATIACNQCGKMHRVDEKEYVVFWGNASVGAKDLTVAGNIDERGRVVGSLIYCRDGDCLESFIEKLRTREPVEKEKGSPKKK